MNNKENNKYTVLCWFDGACWPNPKGKMGWGAIVQQKGLCRYDYNSKKTYPSNSNNVAEYLAFIMILNMLKGYKNEKIIIKGDSNMVIEQMLGNWKIKKGLYRDYAFKAMKILFEIKNYNNITLKWIPRDLNIAADELSQEGMKLN